MVLMACVLELCHAVCVKHSAQVGIFVAAVMVYRCDLDALSVRVFDTTTENLEPRRLKLRHLSSGGDPCWVQ